VTAISSGADAEAQVTAMHTAYRAAGRAYVVKQQVPVRQLAWLPGGHIRGVYVGQAPVDYLGALAPSGRCVALEVKSTARGRLPLTTAGKPTFRAEQALAMRRLESTGALVLALVCLGGAWWACPWGALERRIDSVLDAGGSSLAADDMAAAGGRLLGTVPRWLDMMEVTA
jgi:hypothetical protein